MTLVSDTCHHLMALVKTDDSDVEVLAHFAYLLSFIFNVCLLMAR